MSRLNQIFRANVTNRQSWVKNQLKKILPGAKILDVGCGGQPYRKYCDHLEYKAHDFAMLDASTQINEGKYGFLDYVSDISHIPEKDCYFDVILNTEVLEHVPEPIQAIKEMYRLLKPGGKLFITAPLNSFQHQTPYHFYGGFSRFWYERNLKEAGFGNIKVEQNGGFFMFFGQECQRFNRILFRRRTLKTPLRWLLMPLEIFTTSVFAVLLPLICHFLDELVYTEDYTIGYHVTAEKQ